MIMEQPFLSVAIRGDWISSLLLFPTSELSYTSCSVSQEINGVVPLKVQRLRSEQPFLSVAIRGDWISSLLLFPTSELSYTSCSVSQEINGVVPLKVQRL